MVLLENRKARFEYQIESSIEAGLILSDIQVKSIYSASVSLSGTYVKIENGIPILCNFAIKGIPTTVKLLLKKKEVKRISKFLENSGTSIIPLDIHNGRSKFLKMNIALAKGRKKEDKREYIKERESKKEFNI